MFVGFSIIFVKGINHLTKNKISKPQSKLQSLLLPKI